MRYAYPVELEEAPDGVTVTCPDIPELVTEGSTRADALAHAGDALVSALSLYVDDGRALPRPSAACGRPVISVAVLEAAKLALHDAMVREGISNVQLGHRLGMNEKAVRRLRDPLHKSHVGAVENALQVLGTHLKLVVVD